MSLKTIQNCLLIIGQKYCPVRPLKRPRCQVLNVCEDENPPGEQMFSYAPDPQIDEIDYLWWVISEDYKSHNPIVHYLFFDS